jgi:hypothetical protein
MSVFTENDFNNNNGMLTAVWGPSLWHALHCISVNYPVKPTAEDKQHYKDFILSLRYVLPCKYCRDNIRKNLKNCPLNKTALKNRKNFSNWMYNFHEIVNNSLEKKSGLTFGEVRERYEHFRARCSKEKKPTSTQSGGGLKTKKTEGGCTEPIYGVKSKCQIHIVPQEKKGLSLSIHPKCFKKRNKGAK